MPHFLEPYFPSATDLFLHTDTGNGSVFHIGRRQLKFLLRSYLRAGALRETVGVFANSELSRLPRLNPQLLTRPLREYLRHGMSPRQRVQALRAHFRCLGLVLPRTLIEALYGSVSICLHEEIYEGAILRFCLEGPDRWGREGEITLHMSYGASRVMTIAFSLAPGPNEAAAPTMLIGALQGGLDAEPALRDLGRSGSRLRPHSLMLVALQGLAAGWGIGELRAVSSRAHIYATSRSPRRKVGIDYDALWADSGGSSSGDHWLLPGAPRLRPESEVPSKKRSMHRRRNLVKTELFERCKSSARAMRGGSARQEPSRETDDA